MVGCCAHCITYPTNCYGVVHAVTPSDVKGSYKLMPPTKRPLSEILKDLHAAEKELVYHMADALEHEHKDRDRYDDLADAVIQLRNVRRTIGMATRGGTL